MNKTLKWTAYTVTVVFGTYWFANLILWYPWSYHATLGITLMFVVAAPIWVYAIYNCLKRHHGGSLLQKAIITSLIFSVFAIVSDYIFYGLIRDALAELLHPAVLYGYVFLIALPFIEVVLFKKRLAQKKEIKNKEFAGFGLLGILSLSAVALIVIYDIRISDATFLFMTYIFVSLIVINLIIWVVLGTDRYIGRFIRG